MNKFSDGFSDNSYEDLLNEYAGESLGSKSPRRTENKETPPKRETLPRVVKPASPPAQRRKPEPAPPEMNIPKRAKKPSDFSLNLNTIKSFDDELKSNEKRSDKQLFSDTTEFSRFGKQSERETPTIEKRYEGSRTPRRASAENSAPRKKGRKPAANATEAGNPMQKESVGKKIVAALKANKNAFIIFAACFAVAIVVSTVAISCINDIFAINRDADKVIEVVLPNDADTDVAIDTLHDAGLIKNKFFCKTFIKFKEKTERQKPYLPGVYYFTESMGVEKMISRFKTSAVRGNIVSVTIPEGFTIDQIFQKLEKNDVCTADALYKTVDSIDFSDEYDFIQSLENKSDRYLMLEGYMFPATYEFQQGADPATVIREFLNAFKKHWTEDYAKRAEELSMTVDEVIRLASIIEKEGNGSEQFKLVSSVLHNRLNRSAAYPRLECDSTGDYVTNYIGKRKNASLYRANYDTYECVGLPVGAICNPGLAAIEAALNPEPSQNYFFRHDKNGKIYLAETYEQHQANRYTVEKVNAQN